MDKSQTNSDEIRYYRADDCHGQKFYVVKSQNWTKFQTIMAECRSPVNADEIILALNKFNGQTVRPANR